ncbi:uncharacterized protein LOC130164303 [Seriola aureovittata]|uniref:uncharacterized protein LOC130164303 n=1 Tax=Seriola aureovittata TaxID=2871759 RepID=UPI0024BD7934|nr:uncharacterized protein LOC130164303 [Seriola aureovittata]
MTCFQLLIHCFLLSAGECGSHALVFLSTGRVQPGNQLSFEQLTVFDGVPISHCDSSTRTEEFKPSLESKNLPSSCEAAYSDITESLHVIPPLINSTVYVVQRRRGCIQSADGRNSAFEAWSVNGEDFITFDPESQRWTPQSPSAVTVKQRWKRNGARNIFFSRFIRQQCPVLIQRIRLRSINPRTDLNMFAKPIAHTAQILLICHVTSTDRPVSSVHLTGDGAPSARWITVTGPVPGPEDGSVVLRLTPEISLSQHTYRCAVQAGGHNISAVWDGKTLDGRLLLTESSGHWKTLILILEVLGVVSIITIISWATVCLLNCVKTSRPRRVDPQLMEQFVNVVISFTQGSERNPEHPARCEMNIRLRDQNFYDPEYFANLINGADR